MTDLNVLLFVNAPEASPWQNQKLAHELAGYEWCPMKNVGWFSARFRYCESDGEVLDITNGILRLIADDLGMHDLNAMCFISDPPRTTRDDCFIDGTEFDECLIDTTPLPSRFGIDIPG